ncbi:MAG: aldo/keto reductase [Hyphomicrobium sp.]|uniref:aldo/keto reductase n=1 Tax=Hyphomicrobium sp. TaxID=82 RepID=UPI0025BE0704|nr:aldo/keto reductase [Hyphomicrobium sp.]MBZ0211930.1 aldo/keto reductase [Hyphomicrobium sp.]
MSLCQADKQAGKTALPKRRLGRTDMLITPVGLGAWAIGGGDWAVGWGSQDDKQSIAAIRHAVERGVNWIDTAAIYGLGHSEEIVRRALMDIPVSQRPLVFTKCGLRWDEADRMAPPHNVGDPKSIRFELEASLKRLGVDRIDLYQMHWPARDGTPIEEYWQALLDLKAEGKVRAIGLSNHNVAQLEAAEKIGHVDTLQPPFSAIRREFAAAELPWCVRHDTGVIVYSPMQAGLLTGAFTAARAKTLPANDWRSRNAEFTGDKLKANLELAETMQAVGKRHGTSAAAAAIAWTLAWPGVSGAIVGAREPAQVDGWIDAATLHLRQADLDEIAATIERTGAGSGPALPAEMPR